MTRFRPTARRLALGAVLAVLVAVVPLAVLRDGARPHAGRAVARPAAAVDLDAPGSPGGESAMLDNLERYWQSRVTYPTGRFDARWLVAAAGEAAQIRAGLPAGVKTSDRAPARANAPALSASSFTPYGPQPLQTNNCQAPCFTLAKTSGLGGASYRLVDRSARPGARYTYRLQAVGLDGKRVWRANAAVR